LRRQGRSTEADVIAEKINFLISEHRNKQLARLAEASPKELWASVKGRKTCTAHTLLNGAPANADDFNSFFANIATDPDYNTDNINKFRVPLNHNSVPTSPAVCHYVDYIVHDYEIEPILRSLKRTAPGIDNLPAWLFKSCSIELAGIVAKLLTLSFKTGKVYSSWLNAIVTIPQQLTNSVLSLLRQYCHVSPRSSLCSVG
jgi:hypothetical protein